MKATKFSPEETAASLIEDGWTAERYEKGVQAQRLKRLDFWQEKNLTVLIENEKELVAFGETVIAIMRLIGEKPNRKV